MGIRLMGTGMDAFDFSADSRIRESLLSKIKAEYFGALEDDQLDFLNAAGTPDERKPSGNPFSGGEKGS